MCNEMTDKRMNVWAFFVQSLFKQQASNRENDLGIFGKRPQRERRGIVMKSKSPR